MRRILSAVVLVLAFCCPVSAGIIHNPPPAPSPLTEDAVLVTADAEMAGEETSSSAVSDSLTEIMLDLLAVLPALF